MESNNQPDGFYRARALPPMRTPYSKRWCWNMHGGCARASS